MVCVLTFLDLVCFLDVSPAEAAKRGGFGDERYETQEIQSRVRRLYDDLVEDNWKIVNTDGQSLDEVFEKVKQLVEDVIVNPDKGPIQPLWPFEGKPIQWKKKPQWNQNWLKNPVLLALLPDWLGSGTKLCQGLHI